MPHHGHFVERRLAVENDKILVADVSLYFISALEMKIGRFGMEPQINSVTILSDDVLCTRVLRVTTLDELLHLLDVERCHDLWKGHVLRNTAGNTDLINSQIRIGSNDGTSREVHSLSHQVTTNTPFFACQFKIKDLDKEMETTRILIYLLDEL